MELKSVLFEKFTEFLAELAAEDLAECFDGQEESARRVYPSGTIESQTSRGNDVVYMGMMLEVLSPGVEHAEESNIGTEMLGIASEFEQRSGAGAEEQIVEQPLVLEDESEARPLPSTSVAEVSNGFVRL